MTDGPAGADDTPTTGLGLRAAVHRRMQAAEPGVAPVGRPDAAPRPRPETPGRHEATDASAGLGLRDRVDRPGNLRPTARSGTGEAQRPLRDPDPRTRTGADEVSTGADADGPVTRNALDDLDAALAALAIHDLTVGHDAPIEDLDAVLGTCTALDAAKPAAVATTARATGAPIPPRATAKRTRPTPGWLAGGAALAAILTLLVIVVSAGDEPADERDGAPTDATVIDTPAAREPPATVTGADGAERSDPPAPGDRVVDAPAVPSVPAAANIEIRTVPAVAGLAIAVDGEPVVTDVAGVAAIVAADPGSEVSVLVDAVDDAPERIRVIGWSDGIDGATRAVSTFSTGAVDLVIAVDVRVTVEVDDDAVRAIEFVDTEGGLTEIAVGEAVWVTARRGVIGGSGVTLVDATYRPVRAISDARPHAIADPDRVFDPAVDAVWSVGAVTL